jgi:hypothetical protein
VPMLDIMAGKAIMTGLPAHDTAIFVVLLSALQPDTPSVKPLDFGRSKLIYVKYTTWPIWNFVVIGLANVKKKMYLLSRICDSKIWPRVLRDSDPKMTALARTSRNCKGQIRPLVREGAPN